MPPRLTKFLFSHFRRRRVFHPCRVPQRCRQSLEHAMGETSELDQVPRLRPKCRNANTVGKRYHCYPHLPPDNLRSELAWTWFPWEYVTPLVSSASQRAPVGASSDLDMSTLHRIFLLQLQVWNNARPSTHCRRPHSLRLGLIHRKTRIRHSGFLAADNSHQRNHRLLVVHVRSIRNVSHTFSHPVHHCNTTDALCFASLNSRVRLYPRVVYPGTFGFARPCASRSASRRRPGRLGTERSPATPTWIVQWRYSTRSSSEASSSTFSRTAQSSSETSAQSFLLPSAIPWA
jgi:hypothetical protein